MATTTCPSCQRTVGARHALCTFCGTHLEPPTPCPGCKRDVPRRQVQCKFCGAAVAHASPADDGAAREAVASVMYRDAPAASPSPAPAPRSRTSAPPSAPPPSAPPPAPALPGPITPTTAPRGRESPYTRTLSVYAHPLCNAGLIACLFVASREWGDIGGYFLIIPAILIVIVDGAIFWSDESPMADACADAPPLAIVNGVSTLLLGGALLIVSIVGIVSLVHLRRGLGPWLQALVGLPLLFIGSLFTLKSGWLLLTNPRRLVRGDSP